MMFILIKEKSCLLAGSHLLPERVRYKIPERDCCQCIQTTADRAGNGNGIGYSIGYCNGNGNGNYYGNGDGIGNDNGRGSDNRN